MTAPDVMERLAAVTSVSVIVADIRRRGAQGTTAEEASYRLNVQPSSYTGRRAELHARGAIERLAEKRDGQHVYVMPEFVNGRILRHFTPHHGPVSPEVEEAVDQLEHWLAVDDGGAPDVHALRTLIDFAKGSL